MKIGFHHIGSISSGFGKARVALFYLLAFITTAANTAHAVDCIPGLYGTSYDGKFDPAIFHSINITNGISTQIGPIGFNRISAMDVDPTSGILYAVAERHSGSAPNIVIQKVLISIDRRTGAGEQIAELTFGDNVKFEHIAGMSFDSSGTLYGYGSWDQGFYTIDVLAGTISRIGLNDLKAYGNALAFSPDDILYHVGDEFLNTVDLTSGLPTKVFEATEATDTLCIQITQNALMGINKTVSNVGSGASGAFVAGDTVEYGIQVSNIGNQTLTGVVVNDTLAGLNNVVCSSSLAPGASCAVNSGSYLVTQADIDNNGGGDGDIDNTAVASSDQAVDVQDSAEAPLAVNTPSMTVTKTSPQTSLTAPGTVIYNYLVRNVGNVTIYGLSLSDDNDDNNMSCDATSIPVGGSTNCSATHSFTQAELDAGKAGNQPAGTCDNGLYNVVTASSRESELVFNFLVDPNGVSAMDYGPETGLYYAVVKNGKEGETELATIDVTTGVVEKVGDSSNNLDALVYVCEIPDVVFEDGFESP